MSSPTKLRPILVWISEIDAHHRLLVSIIVAFACYCLFPGNFSCGKRLILSWDAFALGILVLAWARILIAEPNAVLQTARIQHSTRKWIFLFVLSAACASLGAVLYLLPVLAGSAHLGARHYALALITVMLS
jgi:uncharacterized membrane protein